MQLKKTAFQLHKFLGLITGIIVFVVAVTGCLWVFKEEIETNLTEEFSVKKATNNTILRATEVAEIAHKIYPEHQVHGVVYPNDTKSPLEIIFYDADPEFYESVFIHPVTGEVFTHKNHFKGFFGFILKGHMRLWLPKEIGEQLVSGAILVFLISLISGFILWYPKNIKTLKKRIQFSWTKNSNWKRINFDLHSVIGFYILPFAFILALTGLVLSYPWVKKMVYTSLGGKQSTVFTIPKNKVHLDTIPNAIDKIIPILKTQNSTAKSFELHYPHDKKHAVYVETSLTDGVYYNADYRFFNQYTLAEISVNNIYNNYKTADFAAKAIRMNYDIHVGAIGGIPGKIIAFLASMLIATLPLTGILMWYGRNYKKKKV